MLLLRDALDQIWASSLPLPERRRLAGRAVATAMLGSKDTTQEPESGDTALLDFECLLNDLRFLGEFKGKPSVTEAKCWLRGLGDLGGQFASRLGRLSKQRNRRAHPDAAHSFLHDVHSLLDTIGSANVRTAELLEELAFVFSSSTSTATAPSFAWRPKPKVADIKLQVTDETSTSLVPLLHDVHSGVAVNKSSSAGMLWKPKPLYDLAQHKSDCDSFLAHKLDQVLAEATSGTHTVFAFDRAGWHSYFITCQMSELRLSCSSWDLPRKGGRHALIQRLLDRLEAPSEVQE